MRVIGTAGHVDHGKSTLVRRLTDIDPDRLIEEKSREMTIDLGFAWLPLEDGHMVGIVDVPGHRDFIENMLAGVGGIDAVILVIAADEGIMPQTREHLAILDLLGVQHGLVALTKIDMVDDLEWLDLIETDIADVLAVTSLHDAPIFRVSAHTGSGIDILKQHLNVLITTLGDRPDYGKPRLPIDRVFSISGFGTVVTGTLSNGHLNVGDEIEIQPGGLRGRVRGLQSYQQAETALQPGTRAAVNITGIEKRQIKRGDVLALPGSGSPTTLIDAHFQHLPDAPRPLKHNTQVKVFSGAAETLGHVRLLNDEVLPPGKAGWLQVRLETPLALARGDRFILRLPSPAATIGGGVIVEPHPQHRWKRFRRDVIDRLQILLEGSPTERLIQAAAQEITITAQKLMTQAQMTTDEFESTLAQALQEGVLIQMPDDSLMEASRYHGLRRSIIEHIEQYHVQEPLRLGLPREELRSRLQVKNNVLNALLATLDDKLTVDQGLLRLSTHTVQFSPQQQERINQLAQVMEQNPYTPPSYKEAIEMVGRDVLQALIDSGDIVQVKPDVIFGCDAYEVMVQRTLEIIDRDGSIETSALRDAFQTSRKYAIGLLEYLDSQAITRRMGDARVRGRNAP